MDAEKEFERIKSKYKPLIETWKEDCEILKDIDFLINTLDTMNKRAKINSYKSRFNVLYGKTYYNDTDSFNITRGQRGYGQFMYAMDKLFNKISKSDKSKFTIIKDKGLIFLVEEEK